MGGRLGRKRRGYNVSEPKESRAAAESAENLEVRQNVPENQAASKEQVKTTDLPKQTECPVKADERPGGKQTALAAAGVKTVEINAAVATGSTSAELNGSKMQENVISDGLVEVTKQLPDQAEQPLLTEADVQSTAVPETDSAAEVPDALVPCKNEPQSKEIPDCSSNGAAEVSDALVPCKNEPQSAETPDCGSNGEMGESATEITKCCSSEKPSLDDQAVTNAEVNSCGNLAVQADPGKGVSEEMSHTSMALPVSPEALLQCDPEIETSIQELQSESPVKCELEDVELPKLSAIIEETPIDVVLKHEVAMSADLGKDATEPSTRDVQGEVVGEPLHSTTKKTPDSGEQPDYVQHNSAHGNSVSALEDHSQSLKESGNAPVDTSQVVSCSVTDTVQADPVVVESAPENASPSPEKVTKTNCEQTVELISRQESIEEISLLKTSSELIPDIKITVYGEGLQEEEMKGGTQLASASSPDKLVESVALDANADPQPPNEILPENQSTLHSAEVKLEILKSSDQEMVKLETSGGPTPESESSACVEEVSNEESGSTKNVASFVDDGKSATSKSEDDNPPEVSVTNGTTLDGELGNPSKVEAIGQSITAEVEENVQANGLDPMGSKTTEQVIENHPPEESCLKLDNQTPNSGRPDVNVE